MTSNAVRDVITERLRQTSEEGFTPKSDDAYTGRQLVKAAICYAKAHRDQPLYSAPVGWPWHVAWWKPTMYRRNLVKAAALLIAEIERIDRRDAE